MTNEQVVEIAVAYMQNRGRTGQESADKALVSHLNNVAGDDNPEVYNNLLSQVTKQIEALIEAEAEAVGASVEEAKEDAPVAE